MRYIVLLVLAMCCSLTLFAQKKKREIIFEEDKDRKPLIVLDTVASDKKEKTQKKIPKKVFYGYKTKKGYAKSMYGSKTVIEQFYILKEYQEPSEFVRDIYWFNPKKKTIVKGPIPDKEKATAQILHGPYKKLMDGNLVEEGIFYIGTKHGRWEKYDDNFTLIAKDKYIKGFTKESKIVYYDNERKRIKEVIPYMGEELEGDYLSFHENGNIAQQGRYEKGKKVGVWVEFYDFKRRRAKEFQYPETADDEPFEPYLLREYDRSSNIIYDKAVEDKKKASAR